MRPSCLDARTYAGPWSSAGHRHLQEVLEPLELLSNELAAGGRSRTLFDESCVCLEPASNGPQNI